MQPARKSMYLKIALALVFAGLAGCSAFEDSSYEDTGDFPETAYEYAKLVEPILGVPPKIDLASGTELPMYVDGVQTHGVLWSSKDCDNPTRLGKFCISGSVVQRYEGRTASGEPLPHVVWVSFGRNASFSFAGRLFVLGSVQMIGYDRKSGATAFFESTDDIDSWAALDDTHRLIGQMPWTDDPDEFNRAFSPPPDSFQCVACHQNDPFIHNDYIDAAKIAGTDDPVVPTISARERIPGLDLPYYVIGGERWDMRTIHIENNQCLSCHRVGMGTAALFINNGWHPNEHMPPRKPGTMADDWSDLQACWQNTPEHTPGCEWVIPRAGETWGKVVGKEYPFKQPFNEVGKEALGFGA